MTINPVAEIRVPITLDVERVMVFNVNAMCAYEEATGKFFLSTVSDLYEAMFPEGADKKPRSALEIVRRVSMRDLRALLWSTLHEYDDKDDPRWPLTITQVGRHLSMANVVSVFRAFLQGQRENGPSKAEMGESPAARTTNGAHSPPRTEGTGGGASIELPADAFA